jgi:hypothetical protein
LYFFSMAEEDNIVCHALNCDWAYNKYGWTSVVIGIYRYSGRDDRRMECSGRIRMTRLKWRCNVSNTQTDRNFLGIQYPLLKKMDWFKQILCNAMPITIPYCTTKRCNFVSVPTSMWC